MDSEFGSMHTSHDDTVYTVLELEIYEQTERQEGKRYSFGQYVTYCSFNLT